MDWVSGMSFTFLAGPGGSGGHVAGEPDGFRDLAQVIVGEMVAVAAEFPGESPLAEALATGGCVLAMRVASRSRRGSGPASAASPAGRMSTTPGAGGGASISVPAGRRRAACWRVIFTTSSPTDRPANAASGLVAAVSRSVTLTGSPGPAWMWPTFPATLTARPVSAVAHGQTRCRAGQASR